MPKRLRQLLLVSIAIIWFIIIIPYIFVQTDFGVKYLGRLITSHNDHYSIAIGKISHSMVKPYEITIENLVIQDKKSTQTYVSAQKLVVGLQQNDLLQHHKFNYILLENGQVELSQKIIPIETQLLQLKNISVHYMSPDEKDELTMNNIYGGIKQWSSLLISDTSNSQFNFTAQNVRYNQFNIHALFAQGEVNKNTLKFNQLGGDINNGFFIANGMLVQNNQIKINQLKLNNIHYQSTIDSIKPFYLPSHISDIAIDQLSLLNSSLYTSSLIIEKANIAAKNIHYNDDWQLQESDGIFNAESIVWHNELIEQPLIQWHNEDSHIIIEQAIALWNKGNIKLAGQWHKNQLIIDNIIAGGFRYQLPLNWYQVLNSLQPSDVLPNSISIKQFMIMPSLLVDTNPLFPFQFSAFEAFGNNIHIDTSTDNLTVSGKIVIKADSATLNKVPLKQPDFTLQLFPNNYQLAFSSLSGQGIIDGTAELESTKTLQSLILNTHGVDTSILPSWYLVNNPQISNTFTVKLHGSLMPISLDGLLQTGDNNLKIKNNEIVTD